MSRAARSHRGARTGMISRVMRHASTNRPWRPHWGWLPAGAFSAWLAWERYGPVVSVGLVALGLGVGIWAEYRARRRRDDGGAA
jgi:hypothetical protein